MLHFRSGRKGSEPPQKKQAFLLRVRRRHNLRILVTQSLKMPARNAIPAALVPHLPDALRTADYTAVHTWATAHPADFWEAVWAATAPHHARTYALARLAGRWFIGSQINLAAQVLEQGDWDGPALLFRNELIEAPIPFARSEQYGQVASLAAYLRNQNIGKGDVVGVYLPVVPEALYILYATWAVGATVRYCGLSVPPERASRYFADAGVQLLVAADGYRHAGKAIDRMPDLAQLQQQLPELRRTVLLPYLDTEARWDQLRDTVTWLHTFNAAATTLDYRYVGFHHDAWRRADRTLEHGGLLLTALKYGLDMKVQPGRICLIDAATEAERLLWAVRVQLCGGVPVLSDTAPNYPNGYVIWKTAKETEAALVQLSAESISTADVDLSGYQPMDNLKQIVLTGAADEAVQQWVRRELPAELHLIRWDDAQGQSSDWQAAGTVILEGHRSDTPLA